MKSTAHQYEDKLLEFAYGELPAHEAAAVDAHVSGCAGCAEALTEIRAVRSTMSALPMEAAPSAGLDSLMAYAEQAAARNAQAAKPASFWKRFLTPIVSVMALATVGVVAFRANQELDVSPASVMANEKAADVAQAKQQREAAPPDTAPVVVAATPTVPTEVAPVPELPQKELGEAEAYDARRDGNLGGKAALAKNDVWQQPAAPQSVSRREANKTKMPSKLEPQEDYSNVGTGGLRDQLAQSGAGRAKDSKPPSPEPLQAQDKSLSFGLGSGPGGGLSSGDVARPIVEAKKPSSPQMDEETFAPKNEPVPAPAAAMPSTTAAPAPAKKMISKGSYQLSPMGSSSATRGATDDVESIALEKSDSKAVDDQAKFAERQRSAVRTQSLEQARVASSRNDRSTEISLLTTVLQNGATGYEKAEALKRLCDAYEALGQPDRGDPYCDQLLREFPDTVAAKVVTQRRGASQRVPAKAAPMDRKASESKPTSY